MAAFVFIFFYLPIYLIPLAFIIWLVLEIRAPSPGKHRFGALLLLISVLWYLFFGHEVHREEKERARIASLPKIEIETVDNNAPDVVVMCGAYSDEDPPSTIKISSNGFGPLDFKFPTGFDVSQLQFTSDSGEIVTYSKKGSSSSPDKYCFYAFGSHVDRDSLLVKKSLYFSTEFDVIKKHSLSGKNLNDIILSLTDFEF